MDNKLSRKRHLAKTITWRIIASLTTFSLVYLFSKNVETSATVMAIEFVLKMVLYYAHERAWFKYGKLGRNDDY